MVTAIILSGGTGTRLGGMVPKQYLLVGGHPIIFYCLETFEAHDMIDAIIVIAAKEWQAFIIEGIQKYKISKFLCFGEAGESRQHSIWHGLQKVKQLGGRENDVVIIHDAARPNVSIKMISNCILTLSEADGAMPVLPVKDTIYFSKDGNRIYELVDRDLLFAGQTPEGFLFGKYMDAHNGMTDAELAAIRGSSEIAFRHGMRVNMFPGDEDNYKITTLSDLEKFRKQVNGGLS